MSLIYHHTTTDGIIGILESKSIWATDIKFLNDYEEFLIGLKAISSLVRKNKELQKDVTCADEVAELYDSLETMLHTNLLGRSTFIASFTKTRDNIRQWMSYGKPNSSYSIVFERDILENISLDSKLHRSDELAYLLRDVDYDPDSLGSRSLNFEKIKMMLEKQSINDVLQSIVNDSMFGCCSIKSKQFSDENEVRMVLQTRKFKVPYSNSKFRNWGGVITPYITVPIPLNSIREIIIGPSVHNDLAEEGLKKMLQGMNMECEVSHSECTLRQY